MRKPIAEFEGFAMKLTATVGNTFGFSTGDGELGDFYFGGDYMASRTLPYPNAMRVGVGVDKTVRIFSPIDPTFKTLSQVSSNLDELCGTNIEIVNLPLDELHDEIMAKAKRPASHYDLMAVDLPWIGQLATEVLISVET